MDTKPNNRFKHFRFGPSSGRVRGNPDQINFSMWAISVVTMVGRGRVPHMCTACRVGSSEE